MNSATTMLTSLVIRNQLQQMMGESLFFLAFVMTLGSTGDANNHLVDVQYCPPSCACSGSLDVWRVDCSNLNMTEVPDKIGSLAIIIDLSWNGIRDIESGAFDNLRKLKELNLANNLLETISKQAFNKLTALRTLFLQNNLFQTVPTQSLKPLVNLESIHLSWNILGPLEESSLSTLSRVQKLWLDGNDLQEIPSSSFVSLSKLEALNLASNHIKRVPNRAFFILKKLVILILENNELEYISPTGFEGLVSLKVLEINGNHLKELPVAISNLPVLNDLSFADNKIEYLRRESFEFNRHLTRIHMSGNPISGVDKDTFSKLPDLKKLTLSEVRDLHEFPDIRGTSALEHLRIDRANLRTVPEDLCITAPLLRSLNLKSNELIEYPKLDGCTKLRLLDLSYNQIQFIPDEALVHQSNLIDLFLSHNCITSISEKSFLGLVNLQVLDLENNEIQSVHPDAFANFKDLRDLNLGDNNFPTLPTKGLKNLRQLKTYNNRQLKEFPPVQTFPRITNLALAYAYHCCAFIASSVTKGSPHATSLEETIVWLSKDDIDMASWNSNVTDIWPGNGNFSTKFEEFANQLWKTFGRDYTIPDNLAQYAEEYFEDYKALNNEENPLARFALQCLPEPGPFMPCEDLFGWWSLRCGVWVVFLLALLGNGIVVIVLILGKSKMDVPRFLVCNLACADFMMSLYLAILAVVDASTLGEFKASAIHWQTSIGCDIAGVLAVLSTELSVYTLSVITLERNYAITHAMHLNKRLTLRHAGYVMLAGWTFAGAMAALPLFGISDYSKFAICLPFETEDVLSLTYVVFLILINGVAFLILMGCYLKMYCSIRGSQAWNSNDSRIARRMALLVFTDFLCWAPIAFFTLTAVCGLQLISLEEAKVFAIFVLPLNSCANPFLYAIFTKQFKKDCIHICKRIEESRVTRGIGRRRHSSNFSNRHTPVTTNSGAAAAVGSKTDQTRSISHSSTTCECKTSWSPINKQSSSWRSWAVRYFMCRGRHPGEDSSDGYANAIAQIQKNLEKRSKYSTSISSENFSSRSDSWRQGTIPLRFLDQETRRGSWSLRRKASQDSNLSCSRQDSSTSTFHVSRSSFSSDNSNQGKSSCSPRPLLGTSLSIAERAREQSTQHHSFKSEREVKPKLCRQKAVFDEKPLARLDNVRKTPNQQTSDIYETLCPLCARKEINTATPALKSKKLEESFVSFCNRLVFNSHVDKSGSFSRREDRLLLSSDRDSMENRYEAIQSRCENVLNSPRGVQQPHIEVSPIADSQKYNDTVTEGLQNDTTDKESTSDTHISMIAEILGNERCKSLMNIDTPDNENISRSSDSQSKLSLSSLPATLEPNPFYRDDNKEYGSAVPLQRNFPQQHLIGKSHKCRTRGMSCENISK